MEPVADKWIRLAAQEDKKAKKVIITVTDSGLEVPETERERIFQPFYTTKPAGKGTGQGLSLSSKIIKDHGGSLRLDPASGDTVFIIELPKVQGTT